MSSNDKKTIGFFYSNKKLVIESQKKHRTKQYIIGDGIDADMFPWDFHYPKISNFVCVPVLIKTGLVTHYEPMLHSNIAGIFSDFQ